MKNKLHKLYVATFSTLKPPAWRITGGIALCMLACIVTPVAKAADGAEIANGKAVMNFVGADIESVIKAVGQYTNTTFIIDPRVTGTINLVSEKALTKSQAFDFLASTLRLQGYAVVRGNGFVKVVPEADAKLQLGPTQVPVARGDQIATQIFALNYESATNISTVLRPLISPNNTININPGNNTLIITDYAENLQRLGKIIAALDVPAIKDLDVIPVRYAVASDIAVMAGKLLDAGPSTQGGNDSGRIIILADSRTNSVIIRAPSSGRANLAKSLIAKLDQPTIQGSNIHVVYLKNADAVKLARTLRSIVSFDVSAQTSAASSASSTGIAAAGSMLQNPTNNSSASAPAARPVTTSAAGEAEQSSGAATAGFIQADETTNTLIISASEPVYRDIRGVIDQLDTRRAQVYVEALIVEVTDTLMSQLGVQWLGVSGNANSNYRVAGISSFGTGGDNIVNQALAVNSSTPTVVPPSNGMTIGIFRQIAGQIGLGALATALDGKDGSNVLSMPNLLTLDNEEAKIIVGQNVPFITGSYVPNSGSTASNPFQTIERKDVGVALRVRPHISEGGTVRMEISQEVSSVDPTSLTNAAGLITNKRSLDTNVVMNDGEIIVLGGLIGDNKSSSVQKVPLLGDIPFIGNFFKFQSNSRIKTNLMIFLRPTVIRNKEQSGTVVMDRYDYMRQGQINVESQKSMWKDSGSAVLPSLQDGGPFMKLPPKTPGTSPVPLLQEDLPAVPKLAPPALDTVP